MRLTLAAVVAECFEDPELGCDAQQVDELYAERRGLPTTRVALSRGDNGGRLHGRIVEKEGDDDHGLLG